jgi:hypothetical protein
MKNCDRIKVGCGFFKNNWDKNILTDQTKFGEGTSEQFLKADIGGLGRENKSATWWKTKWSTRYFCALLVHWKRTHTYESISRYCSRHDPCHHGAIKPAAGWME